MTTFNSEEQKQKSREMSLDTDGSLIEKEPTYITFRKGVTNSQDSDIRLELKTFQDNMMLKLDTWFAMQNQKFLDLLKSFEDVKTSIKFISDKYDELDKRTKEVCNSVHEVKENTQMHDSRIAILEARLESMEQRARSCNIEISNLPERRGENLVAIMESLSSVIKQPVSVRDIISIHRVPQVSSTSSRPKNVVVKFSSQLLRDNFISAVRQNKGITTDQLNMQGTTQKVYVNEHLTLQNKKLFRQVRDKAKQNGYRFVWIKHGVVLTRADVTTAAIAIRSERELHKITPYNSSKK